ncbi:MAG: cell division protein FtsZ [Betaproteobacteria bacterium]
MDLTVSLAVLAVLVLAGVGAQAWWTARRAQPRRGPPSGAVPVQGGGRQEPSLGAARLADDADAAAAPASDIEGAAGGHPHPVLPGSNRLSSLRPVARLDALIDAIVTLTLEAPVTGDLAVAHLPASWRAGSKPLYVEGLNPATQTWEQPVHGQTYAEFQAGVQLANRAGAVNEIEYSEFVQKIEAFAQGVGAMADFPDMLEVVARARELDAFSQPLDAQLSLLLRARSVAWSLGYVQQTVARHGFIPGVLPGRMVLPGLQEGDPPVLVLSFDPQVALADDPQDAALREVQLSLDVAQTQESAEPFPAWHRAATALAGDMDALLVDDQGRAVTLHAFDAIGKELQELYRSLESRDLAAGSAAARRLFS